MNKSDKDRCGVSAPIHNCVTASDCSQRYLRFTSVGVAHSALREAKAARSVATESTRHLNIRVQILVRKKPHCCQFSQVECLK